MCFLSCYFSVEDIDDARSKFRIITTSGLMLFALAGSVIYIKEGRRVKRDRSESLYTRNKERYQKEDEDK